MKNWTLKKYLAATFIAVVFELLFALPLHLDENVPLGLALLIALGICIGLAALGYGLYWSLNTILKP